MWRKTKIGIIIITLICILWILFCYTDYEITSFSNNVDLIELVLALSLALLIDRQQQQLNKYALRSDAPTLLIKENDLNYVITEALTSTKGRDSTKFRVEMIKQKREYLIRLPMREVASKHKWWHVPLKILVKSKSPVTSIRFISIELYYADSLKSFIPDKQQEIQASFFDGETLIVTIAACFPSEMYQPEKQLVLTLEVKDISGRKQRQCIYADVHENTLVNYSTELK